MEEIYGQLEVKPLGGRGGGTVTDGIQYLNDTSAIFIP